MLSGSVRPHIILIKSATLCIVSKVIPLRSRLLLADIVPWSGVVKKTEADAVCHGEGDLTIVELVNHFLRPFDEWQNDLESITGISFLKTDNETGKNAVILPLPTH